jgi:hypothetical protein
MDKDTINLLYILGIFLACGLIIYFIANRKSNMDNVTTTTVGYVTNQSQFPWLFNSPYYYDDLYGYDYPYYVNSPWWWGGGGYGTSWYGGSHHSDGGHGGGHGGHHGGGHGGGGHSGFIGGGGHHR